MSLQIVEEIAVKVLATHQTVVVVISSIIDGESTTNPHGEHMSAVLIGLKRLSNETTEKNGKRRKERTKERSQEKWGEKKGKKKQRRK